MSNEKDIAETLKGLITTFCGMEASTLNRETLIDDIGLDSMTLMQIFAALEDEYGMDWHDDDAALFLEAQTLGGYIDLLNKVMDRRRSPGVESVR